MLDAKEVKRIAKELGADLCGIASIDRYEGAPLQCDPKQIMPRAKSVVVFANRINRGALRGIEEGTHFSTYASMGYGAINTVYLPTFVIRFARIFEDEGYECVPLGYQCSFGNVIDNWALNEGFDPPENKVHRSKAVAPGRARPDVQLHMRISAYLAGLGEIGWSKVFLTPEFGPRQRFGCVITEMELEPDPIYDGPPLCNRCMACANDCPGNAISTTESVKVTLAGHEVEWGVNDPEKCLWGFRGAEKCKEGEKGHYIAGRDDFKPSPYTPFYQKPANVYTHGEAICGGRGCMRACMIGLEERGVLKTKFKSAFRTEKPWLVDWSDYDASK